MIRINQILFDKDWNSSLKQCLTSPEKFLTQKENEVSFLEKFVPILDFLGYSNEVNILINKIMKFNNLSLVNKNTLEYLKLFSEKYYPNTNVRIRKVLELKVKSVYSVSWYQESFLWFMVDFKFNSKKMIAPIFDLDVDSLLLTDPFWFCQLNFTIIWNEIVTGKYDSAYNMLDKISKFIEKNTLEICRPTFYKVKGFYYGSRGLIDESLIWFESALNVANKIGDKKVIASSENNLGLVYQNIGDFEKAEKYLLISLQQHSSTYAQVASLSNLAYNYFLKGSLENSFQAYSQAEDLLKNLPSDTPVKGEVKLGLGLIKSIEGNNREALPFFNEALENFTHYNDLEKQVNFHGTLVRLFYDTHEFELAKMHFNEFEKKINSVKSYQVHIPIYAINILLHLDQKKLNEARELLDQLKVLGNKYSRNRLVRVWMNFIQGVYERDICNLNSAEQYLYQSIKETTNKGPYGLLLRSLVALSDIYYQKHILTGNSIYLENMESILTQADEIGSKNPIFPNLLYIKLNKAILHASKRQWTIVDELIEEVLLYLNEQTKFSLKQNILTLIDQIKSQKYLFGEISKGMTSTLFIGMGRQAPKISFKESSLGIIMWKLTDLGADPIALHIPEELIPEELVEVAILLMGQLYVAVLGQGEYYHEGIFGPLPVPLPNTDLRCLLSAKSVKDTSQSDTRLKKKSYSLIGLVYSRTSEIDILVLNQILNDWWNTIEDLGNFSEENFTLLKGELLKRPLKLDLLY